MEYFSHIPADRKTRDSSSIRLSPMTEFRKRKRRLISELLKIEKGRGLEGGLSVIRFASLWMYKVGILKQSYHSLILPLIHKRNQRLQKDPLDEMKLYFSNRRKEILHHLSDDELAEISDKILNNKAFHYEARNTLGVSDESTNEEILRIFKQRDFEKFSQLHVVLYQYQSISKLKFLINDLSDKLQLRVDKNVRKTKVMTLKKNELIEKSILVKNLNTKVTEMDSQLAILKKVAENSKQNEVTIDASKLQQQLDQFNEEIKLLNNENAKLSINSEEFQKCLKDLTENNSLIKKSTLLQEESSKLITKSHESKESLIILKEDNQKLLHQYQDFKREYDVFKTENEQLNSKFSEMDSKIIALTQEVNDKNASITELAEKNDSLVVEKREIEDNIITLQREVDQLKFEKSRTTEDNEDLSKRIEALKAENTSFEEKLDKLKSENVELQENIKKLSDSLFNICQENSKLSESNNSTLKQIIDLNEQNLRISSQYTQELEVVTSMEMKIRKLQKEIDEKENEKENIFSQNEKLESDKGDLEVEKNHLEYQVEDLSKQLAKYKEFFIKMREENIKLSAVRDDFEQLKTSYFVQVEEKMEAMDKSLLEKLAADVELMDNEKGISKSEFNVLINSVPSDLKRKFSTIAEEKFETYDTNNDGIIDQHELSVMVDAIIGKTTSNKGRSMTLDY